ncbi:hypothetical protein A2Z10_02260 [Candidatus Azambacteria bacterium RBG_16_47_10]|uniref:PsbP C-terminal domain-containing protein n=1 Tax=Candidatus Azambacteria bacterium RBG_16_47_10 TaxID=1797292 RepID=A0A1F5AYA9_9BACT|nr:MAG: hypothetical protein A2Z10_02260 [Candidatus Azambacteria bacterium RBG_16_47_10]
MASHKKLAYLIFLLALAGGVVAWFNSPFSTVRPITHVIPAPVLEQPLDTADWKTYKNEELGFEIKLPPRWEKDYKIEEKKDNQVFGWVEFSKEVEQVNVSTNETAKFYSIIFIIQVFTDEQWNREMDYGLPRYTLIAKNRGATYSYIIGQETIPQEQQEIKQVISTFTFINAE